MLGLSREQWISGRPALTPGNELVIKVWDFCAGWNPDRLPMALSYFDVEDVDLMVAQLLALNDLLVQRKKPGG